MKPSLILSLLAVLFLASCDDGARKEKMARLALTAQHPKEFLGKHFKKYDNKGWRHTLFYRIARPSVYLDKAGMGLKNFMIWVKQDKARLPEGELYFRLYKTVSPTYDDKKLSVTYSHNLIEKTNWQKLSPFDVLRLGKVVDYDIRDDRFVSLLKANAMVH